MCGECVREWVCVCVCECVCGRVGVSAGGRVAGVLHTHAHTQTHTHRAQKTCKHTRAGERLNKCRLVMVADMDIPRFLKGVQIAWCGNKVACRTGTPAGKAPHYKPAVHT